MSLKKFVPVLALSVSALLASVAQAAETLSVLLPPCRTPSCWSL